MDAEHYSGVRRLWATVDVRTFSVFVLRCRGEAMTIDEAMTALIQHWNHGGEICETDADLKRREERRRARTARTEAAGIDYRKEVAAKADGQTCAGGELTARPRE